MPVPDPNRKRPKVRSTTWNQVVDSANRKKAANNSTPVNPPIPVYLFAGGNTIYEFGSGQNAKRRSG